MEGDETNPWSERHRKTRIISRNLSKRVQKLEARLIPTDDPMVIRIKYVSPDGTVKDGPQYGTGGLSEEASARPPYKMTARCLPMLSQRHFLHAEVTGQHLLHPFIIGRHC